MWCGSGPQNFPFFRWWPGGTWSFLAPRFWNSAQSWSLLLTLKVATGSVNGCSRQPAQNEWPELTSGRALGLQAAIAPETNFVMSAIVGVAGLEATYEGIRAGKRIGLANKEVLVASGKLVMQAARRPRSRSASC